MFGAGVDVQCRGVSILVLGTDSTLDCSIISSFLRHSKQRSSKMGISKQNYDLWRRIQRWRKLPIAFVWACTYRLDSKLICQLWSERVSLWDLWPRTKRCGQTKRSFNGDFRPSNRGVKGRHWLRDASAVPRRSTFVVALSGFAIAKSEFSGVTRSSNKLSAVGHLRGLLVIEIVLEPYRNAIKRPCGTTNGGSIYGVTANHTGWPWGCSGVEDLHHYLGNGGRIIACSVT